MYAESGPAGLPDAPVFLFFLVVDSYMGEMVNSLTCIHLLMKPQRGESLITTRSSWELLDNLSLSLSLSFSICICFSLSLSVCLSVCLSLTLSVSVCLSHSLCLPFTYSVTDPSTTRQIDRYYCEKLIDSSTCIITRNP